MGKRKPAGGGGRLLAATATCLIVPMPPPAMAAGPPPAPPTAVVVMPIEALRAARSACFLALRSAACTRLSCSLSAALSAASAASRARSAARRFSAALRRLRARLAISSTILWSSPTGTRMTRLSPAALPSPADDDAVPSVGREGARAFLSTLKCRHDAGRRVMWGVAASREMESEKVTASSLPNCRLALRSTAVAQGSSGIGLWTGMGAGAREVRGAAQRARGGGAEGGVYGH